MIENLKHWYDGWFYDNFLAPNQDNAYKIIKNFIDDDSTVLDAGCGTGRTSEKVDKNTFPCSSILINQ